MESKEDKSEERIVGLNNVMQDSISIDEFQTPGLVHCVPPKMTRTCCSEKPDPPLPLSAFVDTPEEKFPRLVPRRAILIMNPFSGNGRAQFAWDTVKPIFLTAGMEVVVHPTEYARHATELAKTLNFNGVDVLLVIGGDGTFNEVVNGLMLRNEPFPPLGLIPGGTGNSVMWSIGLFRENPQAAAEVIVDGYLRKIDLGKVTMAENKVMYMINLLGWGLGVDANETAESCRCCGPCRYDFGAIWQILKGSRRFARCEIDDVTVEGDFCIIMVQNNQHGGSGLRLAPYAKIDDGCLDVVLARNQGRCATLGMFDELKRQGAHVYLDNVIYRRFKKMTIHSQPENTFLNVDGENCGSTPCTIEMVHNAVTIFAPRP
eukprot:TRINITY_DN5783_c0_g1_i3.p1 TRINITY_DN5783_c0_g1~~TRINITY_DN5783_c0_g1_i3.p1  ORF type:complete len:374 (-),score=81.18 TRINITY_DN5783_c0_g1_i3:46-1167(-)